jgi:hypothetical protein
VQHIGQRLYQLGLADSRNTFEQHVTAHQQAGHDAHDVVLVADDDAGDLVAHDAEVLAKHLDLAVYGDRHRWLPSRKVMK